MVLGRKGLAIECWSWCCLLLLLVPGCNGCRSVANPPQESEKGAATSSLLKPEFENRPAVLYPGVFSDEARQNRTKPGHWVLSGYRATANRANTSGRLSAQGVGLDLRGQPVLGTNFVAQSVRPFSLPQDQEKNLELVVYIPKLERQASAARIDFRLTGASGLSLLESVENTIFLKPFQYHWLVLAEQPDEYKYLSFLDCVRLPAQAGEPIPTFYHVVYPAPGQPLPLGPSLLTWTTIAYVLWDNQDPEQFTSDQQQALIDWLHFGGQLIINGPGSLGSLQQSFLAPYLPATFGEARNLSDPELVDFNRYWSIPLLKDPTRGRQLEVPESSPMLGVDLHLNPGGNFLVGTGNLVAERRVGRGRIVLSGIPLDDRRLSKWEGLSSFFHNALLGKPPRQFFKDDVDQTQFRYVRRDQASIFNPMFGSTLRLISRDLGWSETTGAHFQPWENEDAIAEGMLENSSSTQVIADDDSDRANDGLHFGGYGFDEQGGTGTWNDSTGLAAAARENISRIAGIHPPEPDFVWRILGCYLLVLVPLNWLIFRLIGRVEWAWMAMPLISLAGAILVVRMASLDIGFLRSNSQIGVLELQGGYSRGHLTNYSALYTSLSTLYSLQFDNSSGMALPFGARSGRLGTRGNDLRSIQYEQRTENRMRNFLVNSNSTGLLHQESVLDLGGAVYLRSGEEFSEVVNDSTLDIQGAGLVRMTEQGDTQLAWVGELAGGTQRRLEWQTIAPARLYERWLQEDYARSVARTAREIWQAAAQQRERVTLQQLLSQPQLARWSAALRKSLRKQLNVPNQLSDHAVTVTPTLFLETYPKIAREKSEALSLGELFDVIFRELRLHPGEVRLLGHTTNPLAGSTLEPRATQVRQATIVLIHLIPCPFPTARRDADSLFDYNLRSDLDQEMLNEWDDDSPSAADPPKSDANDDQ